MENTLMTFDAPELKAIEKSRAEQIKSTFEPMAKMLTEFENSYLEVLEESKTEITREVTAKAKRLRIDIGKVRIETGKIKDAQKEYIKLEDKAIMGVHNILVWAVKEKEDKLKEIENFFEIQELKKLQALQQERAEKLSKYVDDAFDRALSTMEEDVWNAYYNTKKQQYLDRIEAEKKAEEDRIAKEKAEAQEQERIRKENERLKKEREEMEKKAMLEAEARKKEAELMAIELQKERKAQEERLKKERLRVAEIQAEEKAKREKLEAQIKAKQVAEQKVKEEEEKRLQDELSKGDADKVKDLISDLKMLKVKYSFKSKKNKEMYLMVSVMLDDIISSI